MALGGMDTPEKQKAPREVRGARSEGWESGQVPRTALCVVLIPVVPKVRKDPSPPVRAGEEDMTVIGNNM
jgi:hypothetical protein